MQALPPACYRKVLLPFPRFLLESRDYGRITTGESCTGESCFKNPGSIHCTEIGCNSTFINLEIVRLVLNSKCEIVVHAVFTSVIVLTVKNKI